MVTPTYLIRKLGITARYHGYGYLIFAIERIMSNPDLLFHVTKHLYPMIGEQFGAKSANVERAMRTAIGVCWWKGNRGFLEKMAGFPMQDKPSVTEFIDIVANYCMRINHPIENNVH